MSIPGLLMVSVGQLCSATASDLLRYILNDGNQHLNA
jgi:hypothetical protein